MTGGGGATAATVGEGRTGVATRPAGDDGTARCAVDGATREEPTGDRRDSVDLGAVPTDRGAGTTVSRTTGAGALDAGTVPDDRSEPTTGPEDVATTWVACAWPRAATIPNVEVAATPAATILEVAAGCRRRRPAGGGAARRSRLIGGSRSSTVPGQSSSSAPSCRAASWLSPECFSPECLSPECWSPS